MTLTQFPGDPVSLKSKGATYERIAQSILEASQKLTALATDQSATGDAIDQLRENARTTSGDIQKAQKRYHETALAIIEFGTDLGDAQSRAATAISNHSNGSSTLSTLAYKRRILEEDRATALAAGAEQSMIDDIDADIRAIDREVDSVEYAVANAQAMYDAAAIDREEAIGDAINRIQGSLGELNDGIGDHVRAAFESIADFFAAIAKWIDEVLLPLLQDILVAIAYIALILIGLALVLNMLLLLGGIGILLAPFAVLLAAYLIETVAKAVLQPTPQVRPFDLDPSNRKGLHTKGDKPPYLGDSEQSKDLLEDGYLDKIGGTDATAIEVIRVVGDDGVVRWRVILPSTQDWEFANGLLETPPRFDPKGDQGALNDLGSNALLMMSPQLQAAYEKAVREAMTQAGIKPGEEIMMVGWSQGGILAGAFATDLTDQFNVTAITVAGSPIDHMHIPPTVSVLSVQHDDDVVHTLDLTGPPPNSANWYTISQDAMTGQKDHAADSYARTLDKYVTDPDPNLTALLENQSVFYSGNETIYGFVASE